MPITSFPPAPSRADPATFADKADAYLGHLENPFVAEVNALESNVNAKEASTNALSLAAVNAVNISAWVSGTTYAVGVTVYDPVDLLSYRRSNAGAGTTRPGLDNANWVVLNGLGNVRLDSNQTFTGVNTFAQPINGSGANLTNLNASSLATGTVAPERLGSGVASATTALLGNSTYGRYYDPVAIAEGEVGAPRIWGKAAKRLNTYPVLTVSASDTFRSEFGSGFEQLQLTSPSATVLVAARYTIGQYTGSMRFRASHQSSNGTVALSIFKNNTLVTSFSTTSESAVARSVDVSIVPGDVIEWRHNGNAFGVSTITSIGVTASNAYQAIPLYIAASEI